MKLHPRVTRSLLELVKRFEGLRRRAARLPDGGWTLGYGHTRSAREGAAVSPEDADALLYYDLSEVAEKVEAWTFTPLNQNQFEALIAFAFNIGIDNFGRSTVLKRVNEGQHLMAAGALELWRKADFGGEDIVIDALVRRRAAEKAHYLTPPEGHRPSPTPVLKPIFDHSVIEAAANARASRSAAVVDAPLDGDRAFATLEPEVKAADNSQTDFPAAAAVATGVTTERLHQPYPDRTATTETDRAAASDPFDLAGQHVDLQTETASSLSDLGVEDKPATFPGSEAPLDIPPRLPFEPEPFTAAFGAFPPSPVRRFDTAAFSSIEPPSSVAAEPEGLVASKRPAFEVVSKPSPLFDAASSRSPFDPSESLGSTPASDPRAIPIEDAEILKCRPQETLHSRLPICFSIGLLGVALIAVALFSIFTGKASPMNLVIGLMGILLMTLAGGYVLLRFLNRRDGLIHA